MFDEDTQEKINDRGPSFGKLDVSNNIEHDEYKQDSADYPNWLRDILSTIDSTKIANPMVVTIALCACYLLVKFLSILGFGIIFQFLFGALYISCVAQLYSGGVLSYIMNQDDEIVAFFKILATLFHKDKIFQKINILNIF